MIRDYCVCVCVKQMFSPLPPPPPWYSLALACQAYDSNHTVSGDRVCVCVCVYSLLPWVTWFLPPSQPVDRASSGCNHRPLYQTFLWWWWLWGPSCLANDASMPCYQVEEQANTHTHTHTHTYTHKVGWVGLGECKQGVCLAWRWWVSGIPQHLALAARLCHGAGVVCAGVVSIFSHTHTHTHTAARHSTNHGAQVAMWLSLWPKGWEFDPSSRQLLDERDSVLSLTLADLYGYLVARVHSQLHHCSTCISQQISFYREWAPDIITSTVRKVIQSS